MNCPHWPCAFTRREQRIIFRILFISEANPARHLLKIFIFAILKIIKSLTQIIILILLFEILHHVLVYIVLLICFKNNNLIVFNIFRPYIFRYSILNYILIIHILLFVKEYLGYEFIFSLILFIIWTRFFILYLVESRNNFLLWDKVFFQVWTLLNFWISYHKKIIIVL